MGSPREASQHKRRGICEERAEFQITEVASVSDLIWGTRRGHLPSELPFERLVLTST